MKIKEKYKIKSIDNFVCNDASYAPIIQTQLF